MLSRGQADSLFNLSMDTPEQDNRDLLERQNGDVHRLIDTLKEEQAALTGNALPAFEATTAAKQSCLADIDQGFVRQTHLLAQAGLALDDAGMAAYLRRCDRDGRLRLDQRWRQIKALLGRCREQNLLNGRIVAVNQRQTQRALAILRGGGPTPEDCYGPRGETINALASRALGKV